MSGIFLCWAEGSMNPDSNGGAHAFSMVQPHGSRLRTRWRLASHKIEVSAGQSARSCHLFVVFTESHSRPDPSDSDSSDDEGGGMQSTDQGFQLRRSLRAGAQWKQNRTSQSDHVDAEVLATMMPDGAMQSRFLEKKQLNKELNWSDIPANQRIIFEEAQEAQWSEWLKFGSVRLLSLEESRRIRVCIDR